MCWAVGSQQKHAEKVLSMEVEQTCPQDPPHGEPFQKSTLASCHAKPGTPHADVTACAKANVLGGAHFDISPT